MNSKYCFCEMPVKQEPAYLLYQRKGGKKKKSIAYVSGEWGSDYYDVQRLHKNVRYNAEPHVEMVQ